MIVTCQECQTRFRVKDEMIAETGTSVRCSKCKSVFKVFPEKAANVSDAPKGEFEFVYSNSESLTTDDLGNSLATDTEQAMEAASFQSEQANFEATVSGEADIEVEEISLGPDMNSDVQMIADDDEFGDEFAAVERTEPGVFQTPPPSEAPSDLDQFMDEPELAAPKTEDVFQDESSTRDPSSSVSLPKPIGLKKRPMESYKSRPPSHVTAAKRTPKKPLKTSDSVVFHIAIILSIVVTIVLGFYLRGVRLWKPGEVYWLVKEGVTSSIRGLVIVDYDGRFVSRQLGSRLFVVSGVVHNRSSNNIDVPKLRVRLSSKDEISVPQEEVWPCCVSLPISQVRQAATKDEITALSTAHLNDQPLKPDESRTFVLYTVPEVVPSHFRVEIVR